MMALAGIAGDGSIADVLATYMQGPSSSDRESEDILKTQAELANFQPDGPIPDDVPHDDVEAGDMTHSRSGHDIAHSSAGLLCSFSCPLSLSLSLHSLSCILYSMPLCRRQWMPLDMLHASRLVGAPSRLVGAASRLDQ
jgi:hypothetical protein